MPVYRFQCQECGLSFSARVAASVSDTKCEACGSNASKSLPRSFSISTSVSGGSLDAPPASGFASHDYEVDRIVGQDSLNKWRGIAKRQKEKLRVMNEHNVTGFDIRKTVDGSYRPMSQPEREASERSRNFHFKMADHVKKLKKERE
jgi:putative FmdB family regulatory protein